MRKEDSMCDTHAPHMTDDDLASMESRANRATKGPWKSYIEGREEMSGSSFIMTGGADIYLSGATKEDHDFIAASREDVPKLICEVRRLRKILFTLN